MKGDGIGPEIIDATLKILERVQSQYKFNLEYSEVPAGDAAVREFGVGLPKKSIDQFAKSDACLKGPVGESVQDVNQRLRFDFDLYANIRPGKSTTGITPPALRPDIDVTVIRENSEGFYRAIENEIEPGIWTSTGVFTEKAARRFALFTFQYAKRKRNPSEKKRAPKVTLGTKANVFRKTHSIYVRAFQDAARQNRDVQFEHFYTDALCARLVREPQNFDIVASENLMADLLSDLVGQIAGGLGMTPGTNINYETKHAYFEPTHGSAPDIAGKGIANPIGQIRSAELMLEYLAFVNDDERLRSAGNEIEDAIQNLLDSADKKILPKEVGGQAGSNEVAETLIRNLEHQ
jgi:isocitrate/isopropylmalate dehydrogenase